MRGGGGCVFLCNFWEDIEFLFLGRSIIYQENILQTSQISCSCKIAMNFQVLCDNSLFYTTDK